MSKSFEPIKSIPQMSQLNIDKLVLKEEIPVGILQQTGKKFTPLRAHKYDPAHAGQFVKYESWTERWKMLLNKERKWFANIRASLEFRDPKILFLETRALLERITNAFNKLVGKQMAETAEVSNQAEAPRTPTSPSNKRPI